MTTLPTPINAVDLQGLDQLRRRAARDDPAALAEAAVQFEALFIGMMLESARSASLGGGVFDGPETQQYLELMDRQVALELARSGGFGFGKMLIEQLGPREAPAKAAPGAPLPAAGPVSFAPNITGGAALAPPVDSLALTAEFPQGLPASLAALGVTADTAVADVAAVPATTPEQFVAKLLPHANKAAAALGIEPRLLLAQAALETGWGGAMPQRPDGESAHNLFGIKAGASWEGARVVQWTLEHEDGVAARKREEFRAYANPAASFADYVELISGTPRYAGALDSAGDAEAYARAVTKAGYATDPAYADKWLAIYHGDRLGSALRGLSPPPVLEE